ncbi:MAG: ribonuclease H-like domain-containing protein, partial [Ignavibacteriales bacterium]|nr:ribonuclease H-like domain-containing protein [Ignavibacteriales bacterium]
KIIVIGMLNTTTGGSLILFESSENEGWEVQEKNTRYKGLTEPEMIKEFWDYAAKAERIITFNGRTFDIPFIMIRSALNKVKPSRNFMGNRFDTMFHIDLLEQFSFYGITKRFNLDFYCKSFGVESPKSKGVSGMEVAELYKAGRIKDIAIYCGDDIKATYELYKIWNEYLNI